MYFFEGGGSCRGKPVGAVKTAAFGVEGELLRCGMLHRSEMARRDTDVAPKQLVSWYCAE